MEPASWVSNAGMAQEYLHRRSSASNAPVLSPMQVTVTAATPLNPMQVDVSMDVPHQTGGLRPPDDPEDPDHFDRDRRNSSFEPAMSFALVIQDPEHQRGFWRVFIVSTLVAIVMASITVLLMSFMTPASRTFYSWLENQQLLSKLAMATNWFCGGCLLLFAYITDMKLWRCRKLYNMVVTIGGLMLVTGQIFWQQPLIPLGTYMALNVIVNMWFRPACFPKVPSKLVALAEFASFLLVSITLCVVWVIWAFVDDGNSLATYEKKFNKTMQGSKDSVGHKLYIWARWGSPAIMSLCYAVLALFAWTRSRFHMKNQVSESGKLHLAPELQFGIGILVCLFILAWVGTSIAVQDEVLAKLVLYVSIIACGGMCVSLVHWIGYRRLMLVAETNATAQALVTFLVSDWMKGIAMLLFFPILPFVLLLELVHQFVRVRLIRFNIIQCSDEELRACCAGETRWLTSSMCAVWDGMMTWDTTSVLTKAMMAGLGGFVLQVGISQALVLFLSWFNEATEETSLSLTVLILFLVEIALFLFPPVAGIPLYVTAGIVLIPKVWALGLFDNNDLDWHFAVFCANLFAFFLKMVAIALEQKAIGEPFSKSVAIKRFICVHTPFMKAARFVLTTPGFSVAKVAMLVGGPDWPTSVITGILGCSLCPMLLGSTPVLFLILPCGYAAGYMLCPNCDANDKAMTQNRANFLLALAAMLQGTASFLFAFHAQDVVDSHQEEIANDPTWCQDPQEAEVLERVAADEAAAQRWHESTQWVHLPTWTRLTVIIGWLASIALVYILLNPVEEAFEKFSLDQKISEPPLNGHVLWVVRRLGWWCIGLWVFVCLCLLAFFLWASYCAPSVSSLPPGSAAPHEMELTTMASSTTPSLSRTVTETSESTATTATTATAATTSSATTTTTNAASSAAAMPAQDVEGTHQNGASAPEPAPLPASEEALLLPATDAAAAAAALPTSASDAAVADASLTSASIDGPKDGDGPEPGLLEAAAGTLNDGGTAAASTE